MIMFDGKFIENGLVSRVRDVDVFLIRCVCVCWLVAEGVSYDPRLNQIISCSNDDQTAVVIGCIRTSPSAEIQLTESGFSELKSRSVKPADLKSRKHRTTALTGEFFGVLMCKCENVICNDE